MEGAHQVAQKTSRWGVPSVRVAGAVPRKARAIKERVAAALQAIIRQAIAANALARLSRRHQPLADLLLGVIGDLLHAPALLSIKALRQLLV